MSATLDGALTERIVTLLADIAATEAARPPIEAEIQTAVGRLETLAARADASAPSFWPPLAMQFGPSTFDDALIGALMLIEPEKIRALVADRAKRRAEAWKGLRLSAGDKKKRLDKLQQDLRTARARLERQRREVEAQTGEMQPRAGDDPSVWLLPPAELEALAATKNGRA
jgi:hypothetical protein